MLDFVPVSYVNSVRRFDLYLKHKKGLPVSAQGVSFSLQAGSFGAIDSIYIDASNSSLGNMNDLRMVKRVNSTQGLFDVGLITTLPDQPVNGPIAQIIIEDLLVGANLLGQMLVTDVNVLKSDSIEFVGSQHIYNSNYSPFNIGGQIEAYVTANVADCKYLSRASAHVTATGQYFYEWSTGETTSTITDLAPGKYSVTISSPDPGISDATVHFEISPPLNCPNTITLFPKVFLEGPLNVHSLLMDDNLRQQNLIPLKAPYLTTDSVATSVLAATGDTAVVDWVEVELRSGAKPSLIINRRAGLLLRNGEVVGTDGASPLDLASISIDSAYVAIQHRNHLPALYGPVTLGDRTTNFTLQNGPIVNAGVNQKLKEGLWVAFSGDVNGDLVISAADRSLTWNDRNKIDYLMTDCNLDGACNAADRSIIWNHRNILSQLKY